MKTDSLFFEIFQKLPQTLFELLGEPIERQEQYEFCSVEVKQTAFRIDGVFIPKPGAGRSNRNFLEVQFQKDPGLYERLFSEIMMYLAQNPEVKDWRAIAIYPRRSIEQENLHRHRSLLQSEQFQVVYLDDFLGQTTEQIGVQLMQLIVSKERDTAQYLERLVPQFQGKTEPANQAIIELITTIMVYKFPQLSREEIQAMFTVSDLKQTKVYQEALDEGRVEGRAAGIEEGLEQGRTEGRTEEAKSLVLKQLDRLIGSIALETAAKIRALPLEQVEQLGEALLDFSDRADLDKWLDQAE